MAVYQRTPLRFGGIGLGLNAPPDALPINRVPYLANVREYQLGKISSRAGTTVVATVGAPPLPAVVIARLNDSVAGNAVRLYGLTDGALYSQPTGGGAVTAIDNTYSGNPLMIVDETPPRSPEPWAYVADSARMRKFNTAGTRRPWGLGQPLTVPAIALAQPAVRVIEECNTNLDWLAVGAGGAAANATPVNTTVARILYDSGTTGNCSIVPTAFTNIIDGARLTLNAAEIVIVQQITIAIATTTVAQILYDVGTTGLCTVQPAASLGVGQTVAPPLAAVHLRYTQRPPDGIAPPPAPAPDLTSIPVSRQVDFPVNCVVGFDVGGANQEYVRILSVQVGTDGVQSFRCSTTLTHVAAEQLSGSAAFRCYTTTAIAAAQTVTAVAHTPTITPTIPPGATQVNMVGGLNNAIAVTGAAIVSSATLSRAVLPDDIVHVSLKVDALQAVNGFRLYLDVGDGTFLGNYYFFEWRANDIISAIQATNAGPVDTITASRSDVVVNQQIDPATLQQLLLGLYTSGQDLPPGGLPTSIASTTQPIIGGATSLNSGSLQLAVANNQWVCLRARVGDLIRVGEDTTKTLNNIVGSQVLIDATATATVANPLNASYSAIYITGGFGPNTGDVGVPYVYVARSRDGTLGVVGNGSPPSRGGVMPRRQRVQCTPPADIDTSATLIDWFRIGGLLDRFTYVGTSPNDGSVFTDDTADVNVVGGETLVLDNFQPWPTTGLPKSGTAKVAGSALLSLTGDLFNTAWAPGTPIVVNGFTVLIDQVISTTRLLLRGNAGSSASANWTIANPTLLAQPLPAIWGDVHGVYFACGDANNPATVYWCKPNTLDMVSDTGNALVTGGGDLLQNGYVYDTVSYVASTNNIFRLDQDGRGGFVPRLTAGIRGFWTRWAFCVDEDGCHFLAPDGIYVKVGGGVEQSITDDDLYPLFPHDGIAGVSVNGIAPPDMTQTTRLRLSKIDRYLYFDYIDTGGHDRTLLYDVRTKAWGYDSYPSGVRVRLGEPGSGVHDQILGMGDGTIQQYAGASDNGAAIPCAVSTRYVDAGDVRTIKQFGDVLVKADPNGGAGITAQVIYNDGLSSLPPVVLGAGVSQLTPFALNINNGDGVLARNLGIALTWSESSAQPALELWEPSFLPKVEDATQRATDWDDLGYAGAKFVQGVVIRANTYGATKTLTIEADGATAITLDVNHNGEMEIAYPNAAAGWTPFVGQLLRIVGDTTAWQLYSVRWIFEPAPDAATEWRTQPTTHDLPGYFSVRDMLVAYSADADVTVSVQYDTFPAQTYTLLATGGAYARTYLPLVAGKGRSVVYQCTSADPFRMYQRDCSVRVQSWGAAQGYGTYNPFGGPSRAVGAQI